MDRISSNEKYTILSILNHGYLSEREKANWKIPLLSRDITGILIDDC